MKKYRIEIIIFLIAVIVRFFAASGMIWWESKIDGGAYTLSTIHFPIVEGDGRQFVGLALNILDSGTYAQSSSFAGGGIFIPGDKNLYPEGYITPGYPLLIAIALLLFKSLLSVTFLQIFLAGFSVVFLYKIARFHFSQNIAAIPAMLFAFDPVFTYQSVIVMSDGPFPFFVLGSLFFLLKSIEKKNINAKKKLVFMAVSGLFLGYATITRPIAQLLVLLFLLFFFLKKKKFSGLHIKCALVFIVGFSLFVFPWMLRNKITFGTWQLSSAAALSWYTNAGLFLEAERNLPTGSIVGPWWGELTDRVGIDKDRAVFENVPFMWDRAKSVIFANFPSFLKFYLFKTTTVFFLSDSLRHLAFAFRIPSVGNLPNVSNLFYNREFSQLFHGITSSKTSAFLLLTGTSFWLIIDILMLIGFLGSFLNKKNRLINSFYFLIVLYFALLTGTVYQTRHRIPAMPFMFLLAVWGIIFITMRFGRNRGFKVCKYLSH
jgi:4-amino-4-deoxy-L-arabinose transferase-like glycosyltransferase